MDHRRAPIRMPFAATFAILSLLVAGCTHVTPVKGPDGANWMAVSCSSNMVYCWKRAADECPHGYVTADSRSRVSDPPKTAGARAPTFTGEMLIKCSDGSGGSIWPALEEEQSKTIAGDEQPKKEERAPDPEPEEDLSVCLQAYSHIGELAAEWVKENPDRKPAAKPIKLVFVAVCRDLPEAAQLCLGAPYRATHLPFCTGTLTSLDEGTRRKLDALFVEAKEEK